MLAQGYGTTASRLELAQGDPILEINVTRRVDFALQFGSGGVE